MLTTPEGLRRTSFVLVRHIDPYMSEVLPFEKIWEAHTKMWRNEHAPDNMAALVMSPMPSLRSESDSRLTI